MGDSQHAAEGGVTRPLDFVDDLEVVCHDEPIPLAQCRVERLRHRLISWRRTEPGRMEWQHGDLRGVHRAADGVERLAPLRRGHGTDHDGEDADDPCPRALGQGTPDDARCASLAGVADGRGERGTEGTRVVEPIVRRNRECLGNDRFDGRGHIMAVYAQERRRLGNALGEQELRRVANERWDARDGFVQHAGQRVYVAPSVEGAVTRLLGTHVGGRAGDRALLRDLLVRAIDGARDAEVSEHRVPAGKEDVLGLDVAMDHTAFVRVGQGTGYLATDADRLLDGQAVVRAKPRAHGVALHVGHHVVQLRVRLARVVDGEDVGMLQAGRELDLAEEALRAQCVRQLRVEYLDGDESLVADVVRKVDRGSTAASDLALEEVPPCERLVENG